jgi:hypothetical protein
MGERTRGNPAGPARRQTGQTIGGWPYLLELRLRASNVLRVGLVCSTSFRSRALVVTEGGSMQRLRSAQPHCSVWRSSCSWPWRSPWFSRFLAPQRAARRSDPCTSLRRLLPGSWRLDDLRLPADKGEARGSTVGFRYRLRRRLSPRVYESSLPTSRSSTSDVLVSQPRRSPGVAVRRSPTTSSCTTRFGGPNSRLPCPSCELTQGR